MIFEDYLLLLPRVVTEVILELFKFIIKKKLLLQIVFSALALAQYEIVWYIQHAKIAVSKTKIGRSTPVEIVSVI